MLGMSAGGKVSVSRRY